jgi:hypothetical protein
VSATKVREQLHLGVVTDPRVRALDLDASLFELNEQPIDRHLQDFRKLGDRYICHYF